MLAYSFGARYESTAAVTAPQELCPSMTGSFGLPPRTFTA
jgi:hypothetical protein